MRENIFLVETEFFHVSQQKSDCRYSLFCRPVLPAFWKVEARDRADKALHTQSTVWNKVDRDFSLTLERFEKPELSHDGAKVIVNTLNHMQSVRR